MNKQLLRFDCPKCGAKNSAYISQTYFDVVVHKCSDTLHEVGTFRNNRFTPFEKKESILKIATKSFQITEIVSPSRQ